MAIYTELSTAAINDIAVHFQLTISSFSALKGGHSNSSYCLITTEGKYALTLVEEKSVVEVKQLTQILQYLDKHQFSTSKIRNTITDESVMCYKGKWIVIKKWIDGEVRQEMSVEMIEQVGHLIGQLHQIATPAFLSQQLPFGIEIFPSVIGKGIDTTYENWLEKRTLFLSQNIDKNLPRGLVHADVFFDNVLFEGDQVKAIIDFEDACTYYLIFDLGMAIIGLCNVDSKTIDLSKVAALIRGYEQLRSLTVIEKEGLQLFVEYAAIVTSYWRFWKYNIASPKPNLKDKHWEMANLAKAVSGISKAEFLSNVF